MFEIFFSNQAEKFLEKTEKQTSQRILDKIKRLKITPVPHNVVRIAGEDRTFRLRIGDYRILHEIYLTDKHILITKIDIRPRAYD